MDRLRFDYYRYEPIRTTADWLNQVCGVVRRPKRMGIACQQLRATAALIADWLHLSSMHGWLGTCKLLDRRPYSQDQKRTTILKAMRLKRSRAGLVGGGFARGAPRSP